MDSPDFYDTQIERKIGDFVRGNVRVENALRTVRRHEPAHVRHILDIGCGIGQVAATLAMRHPDARVVAVDTNRRSIETARRLFAESNVEYQVGPVEDVDGESDFDLITCVDVYEHVPSTDRASFHGAIRSLLAPGGRVVLTVPTPHFLAWLRTNSPSEIQPVDEDIGLAELARFGEETDTTLERYFLRSAWRVGDYAHAVFTRTPNALDPVQRPAWRTVLQRLGWTEPIGFRGSRIRRRRRAFVRRQLGADVGG